MRLNALDTLRYFGTLVLPILCKVLDIDSRRHDDGLLLPRNIFVLKTIGHKNIERKLYCFWNLNQFW